VSRFARRVDDNHGDIVKLLRSVPGVAVWDTSSYGRGFVDLLVIHRHALYFCEVKDGRKALSKRRLTKAEGEFKDFLSSALGVAHVVIESRDDALRMVGVT
jgi:hypothetical protein